MFCRTYEFIVNCMSNKFHLSVLTIKISVFPIWTHGHTFWSQQTECDMRSVVINHSDYCAKEYPFVEMKFYKNNSGYFWFIIDLINHQLNAV